MGDLLPLREPAVAESIVSYRGRTTANGAGDGSTVVDAGLTEANDYWNDMTLLILSGASDGQSRDITDFAGGTLTVSPVFSNQIVSGVRYLILPIKPSFAEIADLDVDVANVIQQVALTGHPADSIGKILYDFYNTRLTTARCGYLANINNANLATIADISTLTATEIARLDADISSRAPANEYDTELGKLAGEAIDEDTATKNWNTAVDSPDGAGGIVCTVGSAATKKKVHSLLLDVSALTDTAVIDVKLFMKINGVQQKVYDTEFTIGTDPDGLWVVNGTLGIHDVLTVAVYSDTGESKAIGYTIMTEAM